MLTESERQWLKNRRNKAYCRHCNPFASDYSCPLTGNMKDTAEFEGRVAVKLAKVIANLVKENPFSDVEAQATTPDLVLKWARLSVEEEMDGKS